jgi:hypothetical protein
MPKKGWIRQYIFTLIYALYFPLIKTYADNQVFIYAINVLTSVATYAAKGGLQPRF